MLQKVDRSKSGESNLLTSFFNGECHGTGIVIDRLGRVRDRVSIIMVGRWEHNAFRLDESFTHEDGRMETRAWTVTIDENGLNSFSATCPEMSAPAKGEFTADTVRMKYRFPVPISGKSVQVKFDDRMYRVGESSLFERASMFLFGIRVADIYLNFEKRSSH